ncbi:MAG: CoA transferase [Caulobacteraceae bacterium]|nr:CoA transferase [Caulobacteraceae bacterium]
MNLLKGKRVVDMGGFVTGPLTGQLLGDFGADVIKIEPPEGGDPLRGYFGDELYSPNFQSQNRNKKSLTLDSSKPEGLEIIKKLVAEADVFIINNRPGVADRKGYGYQALRAVNPRLVYCSITGFGNDGPAAQRPSFDNVGQSVSGWGSRTQRGDDPRVASPLVADPTTAYFATMGILAALVERADTGVGRLIEVNMLEAMIAALVEPMTRYLDTGEVPGVFERAAISQAYNVTCKDGKRIGLHASPFDKFWGAMCVAVERPDMLTSYPNRDARVAAYEEIGEILVEAFAKKTRAEWTPILEEAGFPFAAQYELDEVLQDEQVKHLDVVHEAPRRGGKTVKMLRRPIWADGSREIDYLPPPELGEHTDEILASIGLEPARIAELRRAKIV